MSRKLKKGERIIHEDVLHKMINPLTHEFHIKDTLQVVIGATILAVPVGFTEETWRLGESLPWINTLGILAVSLLFISAFVYYNYYRHHLKKHIRKFIQRSLSTYMISFLVVALILTLIERTPWIINTLLAFKRVIIVTLPASMSAAIADVLK